MQLSITITDAQLAALVRSNNATNESLETPRSIEEFCAAVITERFEQFVQTWDERDKAARISAIEKGLQYLDPARISVLEAEIIAAIPAPAPAPEPQPEGGE